jgi:hypothetical protein
VTRLRSSLRISRGGLLELLMAAAADSIASDEPQTSALE